MERTVIPKDCVVCDVCNKACSDEHFIATENSFWYQGWLYCEECNDKSKVFEELKLVRVITKGDDLSKTELAKPIVMEFGE